MRYTEVRMAKSAEMLLADIDKDTVDFQANYDGKDREPVVLPARYPNLLVNGGAGIAVGMATNIPPHNLGEVIDATLALIENPDQLARWKANPDLTKLAIDEIVRYVTPVNHMVRTATEDYELRGQTIREGDKLVLFYASANRDEDIFDDSQTFDITRNPNPHLSFGIGEHFCLGSNLARMELQKILSGLMRRIPDIRLAAEPRRLRSNFINGIKEMRVEFTPGKRIH